MVEAGGEWDLFASGESAVRYAFNPFQDGARLAGRAHGRRQFWLREYRRGKEPEPALR